MSKIAIVGFGGAGYCAAREIRQHDRISSIDVYSDTNVGPYNPMLTTYYVKGAIPYEALFPFGNLDEIEKELDLNFHADCPVTGLIPEKKELCFADGSKRSFDQILFSTGASAIMPPIPGIDLPGVIKMRTVQDAVHLKKILAEGTVKTALVIGASWVGIKVIEDLVENRVTSTLVDGAKWMFYVAAFEETALRVQKDLEAKGVKVSCGQMLSQIQQEADGRLTAVMQNGCRFTADLVAVCIGMRMNVGFLKDSGLKIGRGIQVDCHMCSNYEGIYAAGDCAEAVDIQAGMHRNIAIWYNARTQGQVAGANMAGALMEFDANVLVNLAHYLDYDFISIGDVAVCRPEDRVYEYEDDRYYIRAVRSDTEIKCINMIGSAESNGLFKSTFIKSIKNPNVGVDVKTACCMRNRGFPDEFIDFLGGITID